ncbi:MAG: hypothetical protein H6606_10330 [Flavobacteriales bacterium]|nr:hypothetical protein [Flavobacteriales bacterium]
MMEFREYLVMDLESTPETPGIYSWHLKPKNIGESYLKAYQNFSNSKLYRAEVSSDFAERYLGDLKPVLQRDTTLTRLFDLKQDYILSVVNILSAPLYIGYSKNINRRLVEHKRRLLEVINKAEDAELLAADLVEGNDDEGESRYFAFRVGKELRSYRDYIDESSLVVKVFEYGHIDNYSGLKQFENYLNRTTRPIFGKR